MPFMFIGSCWLRGPLLAAASSWLKDDDDHDYRFIGRLSSWLKDWRAYPVFAPMRMRISAPLAPRGTYQQNRSHTSLIVRWQLRRYICPKNIAPTRSGTFSSRTTVTEQHSEQQRAFQRSTSSFFLRIRPLPHIAKFSLVLILTARSRQPADTNTSSTTSTALSCVQ